jgi:hypothetical protein
MGSGPSSNSDGEMKSLDFTEKSQVNYQIGATSSRYTVFTVPQNVSTQYWKYDSRESLKNLGFMPAFESSPDGGNIVYTKFYHTYLPCYIVSLVTLIFLIVIWYIARRNRGVDLSGSPSPLGKAVKVISKD